MKKLLTIPLLSELIQESMAATHDRVMDEGQHWTQDEVNEELAGELWTRLEMYLVEPPDMNPPPDKPKPRRPSSQHDGGVDLPRWARRPWGEPRA